MKRLAEFILQGLPQAVAVAAGFAILSLLLPPLGFVSSAAIGLVALKVGFRQAIYVSLISSALLAVVVIGMGQPGAVGVLSGLAQWLPLAALGALLGRTGSWSLVMQSVFLVGVLAVVLLYALFPGVDQFWLQTMQAFLQPVLEQAGTEGKPPTLNLEAIAPLITGMLVSALILTSLLALMMARSMQARVENPGGFAKEFEELRTGVWPAGLSILFIGMATFIGTSWANALASVAMVVFLIQGFALLHGIAARMGWPKSSLIGLYVLLVILLTPVVVIMAGIGIVDAFADFRRRLSGPAR
jgi:hypothetical protein